MHLNSLLIRNSEIALIAEFGDRIGNGIVQTTVEGSKLIYQKRRIALVGEIRNGLTQVAIVVNDLVNREPELQQLASVLCR